jgi:hypothetical protein
MFWNILVERSCCRGLVTTLYADEEEWEEVVLQEPRSFDRILWISSPGLGFDGGTWGRLTSSLRTSSTRRMEGLKMGLGRE